MKTLTFEAVECRTARRAVECAAENEAIAVLLDGRNLVISRADLERLEASGKYFGRLGIVRGRLVAVPVN